MNTAAVRSIRLITPLAFAALLAGCNSSAAEQVDGQVAIAQEAADRAVAAQKAAERAAKLAQSQAGSTSFGEDEPAFEDEPFFEGTDEFRDDDISGEDSSYDNGNNMNETTPR